MRKKPTYVSGTEKTPLYERILQILESARVTAARSVNTAQVVANWLIGREIVEEEQRGSNRAEYGQQLILQLSEQLKRDFGSGYSAQSLFYMRQFYQSDASLVPASKIFHAVRGKSDIADIPDAVVRYTLGPDQQKKIFSSRYKLYLPTEAELQAEIRRELRLLNMSPKSGRNT